MSTPPAISPAPSSFIPRKEFLKTQKHTRQSFALLAISGPNCVRLYSFSTQAARTIRLVLEQYAPILASREDAENNLCEYTVDKRPWSNPRSVPSEKLLVDILGAVYQCEYSYLSTMDYGREADDRLIMVFSKTEPASPPLSKAVPRLVTRNESSSSSLGERQPGKRVPFAISFSSGTVMRVISPPLHLTPAILQACRSAWPRGVVSEKTVYESSYEFKLRGYGLFQQDTFATDSLQHILSLLTSLDAQSFSLLASISLTGHSRVKDLWLFTCPAPEDSTSEHLEPPAIESSLRRYSFPPGHVDPQHRKQTTEQSPAIMQSLTGHHNKSSSDDPQRHPSGSAQHANVLRKAAPRAQVPVDVRNSDILEQAPPGPSRVHLPSVVPAGSLNMTGVGSARTPNVFYETSPIVNGTATKAAQQDHTVASIPVLPDEGSVTPPRSPGPSASGRVKTPSLTKRKSSPLVKDPDPDIPIKELNTSGQLLGSDAFRDSAMTSDTDCTREIPIKWTGPLKGEVIAEKLEGSKMQLNQNSPMIPGGWQTTPIAEKREIFDNEESYEGREPSTTPILENQSRVEVPEIVQPDGELRKSEAGLVETMKSTTSTPPIPPMPQRKDSCGGKGWVMVNVENSHQAVSADSKAPEETTTGDMQHLPKPPSLEAKAIVVIDVLNSKNKKPHATATNSKEGDSSVKRLLGLTRKHSKNGKAEEKKRTPESS